MPKETYHDIHRHIQDWYNTHGRKELPWRNTTDPYAIYLSEVMLQQTQVSTVLQKYYFPFLQKFPTLETLSEASLDDVLKMWEGLGYYTRARNLHKTATLTHTLPQTIEALIALPGIGKNTAHAVAAFAFKQPVPVMEANVKRVLCRLHKLTNPSDKLLWEYAYALIDKNNPFEYNQAMMDIGAMICTVRSPQCNHCPLSTLCEGKDEPECYPAKKQRLVPLRQTDICVYIYNDTLALTQRSGKFLHGLWGFEGVSTQPCAAVYVGQVSHAYTHFKLLCNVYIYHESIPKQTHYFSVQQIQKLAISKVDEKILKLIEAH